MELQLLKYTSPEGWSQPLPPWDDDQTFVFVVGAPSYIDQAHTIEELLRPYQHAHIVGCSSAGEIYQDEVLDESLVVSVVRFEHTQLKHQKLRVNDYPGSYELGLALSQALSEPGLRGIFILSDGLNVNGSQLIAGINEGTGGDIPVTGGLAADGPNFQKTWVIKDKRPETGWVTAVGFYGDRVQMSHGTGGGWDAFGPLRQVTRSAGNVLYELDGKPALALYEQYLGDLAAQLPASGLRFPLVLFDRLEEEVGIVRTILDIDRARGALIFAGDIPQGQHVQMMKANLERLINGAQRASEYARSLPGLKCKGDPGLLIATSCVGRRLVLGQRTEEEVEVTLEGWPKGSKQIGFYSYGELCPRDQGLSDLHNQTMTLTWLCEH